VCETPRIETRIAATMMWKPTPKGFRAILEVCN
jgi:hypothetical protein